MPIRDRDIYHQKPRRPGKEEPPGAKDDRAPPKGGSSTAPPAKKEQGPVGVEKVKCLCGHEADFPLYPDKQDKYRERRRDKVMSRACADCRRKAHLEREARAQEAKKARGAKGRWSKSRLFRLPAGAFYVTQPYQDNPPLWRVELHVPGGAGGERVYRDEGPALHTCVERCGRAWRREHGGG